MKVASFDIVFQEIPEEVTLALNISQCPCHCKGCHSPHLAEDTGEPLTTELLETLLTRYDAAVTCVCIMGGDAAPEEVNSWLAYIHSLGKKSAWYSGRETKAPEVDDQHLDFLKLGPYIEEKGGLKQPTTNQRLYRRVDNQWIDITSLFWK